MLASADIVFLVDESSSEAGAPTQEWLKSIVDELDASLRTARGINVRFGLVGFGEGNQTVTRYAHSQIVDWNPAGGKTVFQRLFSEGNHVVDVQTAIDNLSNEGGQEDGWDAIDHAIAEYDFRQGAVPIFVLVQNQEGRSSFNQSLTRDGVLAALQSKGVILNTMTIGLDFPNAIPSPVFDIAKYLSSSTNVRVLGVEADVAAGYVLPNGLPISDSVPDGQHIYRGFDTSVNDPAINGVAIAPATTSQALQVSYNGSSTGDSGMVGSKKSILFSKTASDPQFSSANYRAESVPFKPVDMSSATVHSNLNNSLSIPFNFNYYGTNRTQVWVSQNGSLYSARRVVSPREEVGDNMSLTIDKLDNGSGQAAAFPAGSYIVELFFADIVDALVPATIFLEGTAVLKEYAIVFDSAKITTIAGDTDELDATILADNVGTVKRFAVDVTDGDGDGNAELQIDLKRTVGGTLQLNGVRVLKAAPPRVKDVVIKGSSWAAGVDYSFATLVGKGQQIRPIPTQNANTIEIHFDGPVSLNSTHAGALQLYRTVRGVPLGNDHRVDPINSTINGNATGVNFEYDKVNFIAKWTFPSSGANSLGDGKYAMLLDTSVVRGGGQLLDGDWTNVFVGADNRANDLARSFTVGNGDVTNESGHFRLNFALLPGDYNGDGEVTAAADVPAAGDRWSDGDGDGIIEPAVPATNDDVDVRDNNTGDYLPLRKIYGSDLIDDETVDAKDLAHWDIHYGAGSAGDISGDNLTGAADFQFWQVQFASYSAWWKDLPILAVAAVTAPTPPKVMNVVISGSTSLHAPFSLDSIDGSGTQLQTVPVGGADTISIVFSEHVNVSAGSLVVVGMQTFNLPELAAFNYDATTFTATWRFEGWSLGDQYLLALSDLITDAEGVRLDGEWTNPATTTTVNSLVSEFPSGDGTAGGAFKFVVTLVAGDANLDGAVNSQDYSILALNYGVQTGRLFTQGDFNGDGATNALDFSMLSANWGLNLQALLMRADFDGDWDVDDSDLFNIHSNYGQTGADWSDGDLDGDGTVDADDFDLAFAQFGLSLNVVS